MMWKYVRWTPAAFAIVLYLAGVVMAGRPEPLFIIALLVIQAIILVLPLAANWLGQKVGEKQSGSIE